MMQWKDTPKGHLKVIYIVQSRAYLHVYITLRLRSFANGTPVSYDPFVLVLRKCILQTQYM